MEEKLGRTASFDPIESNTSLTFSLTPRRLHDREEIPLSRLAEGRLCLARPVGVFPGLCIHLLALPPSSQERPTFLRRSTRGWTSLHHRDFVSKAFSQEMLIVLVFFISLCAAGGCSTMQPAGLWTALFLLALSSSALGNLLINDPLAAPRVFISFKDVYFRGAVLARSSARAYVRASPVKQTPESGYGALSASPPLKTKIVSPKD
ncbi:hypothetical protein NQZ68_027603 [Dissostichus eleginoides]|nr:hypothetical protein NQZ68_027603 [Dissostichus eleginoides]